MAVSGARQASIRIILDVSRDFGWRNYGNAAYEITQELFAKPELLESDQAFVPSIPGVFLEGNHVTSAQACAALMPSRIALRSLVEQADPLLDRPLITIGDIDSFSEVNNVAATVVSSYSNPLKLSEDEVEKMIAKILGEPYLQEDWGGELDDMFSGQVHLRGQGVVASFMLKGPGLRAKVMKPKHLGVNGDQISRMMKQPADLYVVQFVGGIDSEVYSQLTDAVIARRARGFPSTVGSIWTGVDTARLGVAYGLLDPASGQVRP